MLSFVFVHFVMFCLFSVTVCLILVPVNKLEIRKGILIKICDIVKFAQYLDSSSLFVSMFETESN